jgi:hypothetical protein
MNQKAFSENPLPENRVRQLCKALEEGGQKVSDSLIAFSKSPGKHS